MHELKLATLEKLQNGTYSIDDLADMHEVIDETEEYARRYEAAKASAAK